MTVNDEKLQDTLDRLTAKIERWNQGRWCSVPSGIDPITEDDLESLSYHDFPLTPEFVEWFRTEAPSQDPDHWYSKIMVAPIADCGTSFCVAGDVCVTNGYTFMAEVGDRSASSVVPNDQVLDVMRSLNLGKVGQPAEQVAQELLGLTTQQANVMFHVSRSLPEIWGLAYAITDGAITLPETLPASTRIDPNTGATVDIPATETAADTRRSIFTSIKNFWPWGELAQRELEKLNAS